MCPSLYLKFIIGSREKLGISSFSSPFNDLQMIIKFYLLPNVDAGRVIAYANPLCIVEGLTLNPVSCLAHGSNETGCRFYCLMNRYYSAIFMRLNQR